MRVRDAGARASRSCGTRTLPTGDYELMLTSDSASIQPYSLVVDAATRTCCRRTWNPTGPSTTARDCPRRCAVDGTGWGVDGEDDDWYRLPVPAGCDAAHRGDHDGER